MKKNTIKALESLLNYTFEHEFEDYIERLCEVYPEDVDYILECQREGNVDSLDKYAWNGTKPIPSVYADAVIIYRDLLAK